MKIEEAKIRFEEIETYTHGFYDDVLIKKRDAKVLLDRLDQPKPVVPKFVAEWYEVNKYDLESEIFRLIINLNSFDGELTTFQKWFMNSDDSIQTLIKMHQFSYTVEKEKLYTVEIPNPNAKGINKFYLCKDDNTGKVYLCKGNFNPDKNRNLKLTEQEIRKDFDWAFRWAEEVTE